MINVTEVVNKIPKEFSYLEGNIRIRLERHEDALTGVDEKVLATLLLKEIDVRVKLSHFLNPEEDCQGYVVRSIEAIMQTVLNQAFTMSRRYQAKKDSPPQRDPRSRIIYRKRTRFGPEIPHLRE